MPSFILRTFILYVSIHSMLSQTSAVAELIFIPRQLGTNVQTRSCYVTAFLRSAVVTLHTDEDTGVGHIARRWPSWAHPRVIWLQHLTFMHHGKRATRSVSMAYMRKDRLVFAKQGGDKWAIFKV